MNNARHPHIHTVRQGQGPKLVLVHGVGASLENWNGIAERLVDGFDVLRMDLRGHGQSSRIDGTIAIDDFAHDVIAAMDEHGFDKAHLVGFSLGGLIAQKLAVDWAPRFARVVLISAVAGRTAEERQKVVSRLDALKKGGIDAVVDAAKDRWFTDGFVMRHPEQIARRIDELRGNDLASYLEAYRVFGTTELVDDLHRIPHPTLIMTGEHDAGSNVRMAETMRARIPDSTLHVLPGLKHSVLIEAPQLIADHVRRFLESA